MSKARLDFLLREPSEFLSVLLCLDVRCEDGNGDSQNRSLAQMSSQDSRDVRVGMYGALIHAFLLGDPPQSVVLVSDLVNPGTLHLHDFAWVGGSRRTAHSDLKVRLKGPRLPILRFKRYTLPALLAVSDSACTALIPFVTAALYAYCFATICCPLDRHAGRHTEVAQIIPCLRHCNSSPLRSCVRQARHIAKNPTWSQLSTPRIVFIQRLWLVRHR